MGDDDDGDDLVMLQDIFNLYHNVCYDLHQIRYLLCCKLGKSLPFKVHEEALDGSEENHEVFEENYRLFFM